MNELDTLALELIDRELDTAASPCLTSSFQAECVVLVHLVRRRRPDIPVLFLDTVHHFAETSRYAAEIADAWGLQLVTLRAADPAPGLWRESTQACCARHKVEPLFAALRPHDTWFTGLRRQQSASRAGLQEVEPFSLGDGVTIRKVSPLAQWTTAEVWRYAKAHGIPVENNPGLAAALSNVEINLSSIKDADFVSLIRSKLAGWQG